MGRRRDGEDSYGAYEPPLRRSKLLLVRRDGTRFINEDLGAQSLSNVIMRCPGEVAYCVTGDAQGPKVLQPGPDAVKPEPSATVEEAAAIVR